LWSAADEVVERGREAGGVGLGQSEGMKALHSGSLASPLSSAAAAAATAAAATATAAASSSLYSAYAPYSRHSASPSSSPYAPGDFPVAVVAFARAHYLQQCLDSLLAVQGIDPAKVSRKGSRVLGV
jgi:hypothetical protein